MLCIRVDFGANKSANLTVRAPSLEAALEMVEAIGAEMHTLSPQDFQTFKTEHAARPFYVAMQQASNGNRAAVLYKLNRHQNDIEPLSQNFQRALCSS